MRALQRQSEPSRVLRGLEHATAARQEVRRKLSPKDTAQPWPAAAGAHTEGAPRQSGGCSALRREHQTAVEEPEVLSGGSGLSLH